MTAPALPLTARLSFRELSQDDLDFIFALRSDAEVMRFYPSLFTRERAQWWIDKQLARYRAEGHGFWLVSERGTGHPVGTVGVVSQLVQEQPLIEVGYMLAASYWRQGLATEAARACRDWAFTHLALDAVYSLIRPVNVPSQRVAKNNGMSPCRRVMFHELEHDVWRITREEWRRENASSSTTSQPG